MHGGACRTYVWLSGKSVVILQPSSQRVNVNDLSWRRLHLQEFRWVKHGHDMDGEERMHVWLNTYEKCPNPPDSRRSLNTPTRSSGVRPSHKSFRDRPFSSEIIWDLSLSSWELSRIARNASSIFMLAQQQQQQQQQQQHTTTAHCFQAEKVITSRSADDGVPYSDCRMRYCFTQFQDMRDLASPPMASSPLSCPGASS